MAKTPASIFEVRTTGNDANGGLFDAAFGGTDYSQQDSAQLSLADVVTNGTAVVTSATGGFTAAMVGNGINIAGTIYQIVSRTDTNTIGIDANAGAAAGQVGKVGGALASIGKATGAAVLGNVIYVKAGAGFTITANIAIGATVHIVGYGSARGDGNKATVTASGGGVTDMFSATVYGVQICNIEADAATLAGTCFKSSNQYFAVFNCIARRYTSKGITAAQDGASILHCEVKDGVSGCSAGIELGPSSRARDCYVHDNPCVGIKLQYWSAAMRCIVANNSGASSDGIQFQYASLIDGNTCYNNGRDGVRLTDNDHFPTATAFLDNILYGNAGYGVNSPGAGTAYGAQQAISDFNAFRSNTSGARNVVPAGAHDVTLTGDPFTNAGAGDYSLNSTAGAGAACRAAGFPGVFQGGTSTGYLDIGAVQHQDAGGGGTTVIVIED